MPSEDDILNALKAVKYPGYSRDIVSFGIVKDVAVANGAVSVGIHLTSANAEAGQQIKSACEAAHHILTQNQKLFVERLKLCILLLATFDHDVSWFAAVCVKGVAWRPAMVANLHAADLQSSNGDAMRRQKYPTLPMICRFPTLHVIPTDNCRVQKLA